MFNIATKEETGKYLLTLIEKNFDNQRRFAIAYLEVQGEVIDEVTIQNMANRVSQIVKGNKAIQTYDLPIFTHLLGVSSEEILSAGKHFVPLDDRMTNYKFAFTDDEDLWTEYLKRPDKPILNRDEFGKTVIDYAIEFKNYKMLKFLMDNNFIWFVDEDAKKYGLTFRAGTSIAQKPYERIDTLDSILAEDVKLRLKMISLAIENNDIKMLDELKAREVPEFYLRPTLPLKESYKDKFYSEEIILDILKADEAVIEYFSSDFSIKNRFNNTYKYIYPFIEDLLQKMIETEHPYTDKVLSKCTEHNIETYKLLKKYLSKVISENNEHYFFNENQTQEEKEQIVLDDSFYTDEIDNLINFRIFYGKYSLITNIVVVRILSSLPDINKQIKKLNMSYKKIMDIKDIIKGE